MLSPGHNMSNAAVITSSKPAYDWIHHQHPLMKAGEKRLTSPDPIGSC